MVDFLNSLAGGYAQGQAQFKANEAVRKEAAEKAAKAAQDAAEFRLKLAQHSQTLTNSAETEYNAIMDEITADDWDPAKIPALMPRVANFDKTYGAVWGGGSAAEMVKKALHLDPTSKPTTKLKPGTYGPADQPRYDDPLMGFTSEAQKGAADDKARKARTKQKATEFAVGAAEYARNPNGGMPDEATFYRKVYEYQDMLNRTDPERYDLETINEAMKTIREAAAGYFKGLASNMDLLAKQSTMTDAISERTDKVIRNISSWVNQLLMFDANGASLTGDLFAERTPLRLEMEREAAELAMQGMSEGQIRSNLIFKHREKMGGLELDIKQSPYSGSLTLMGADPGFQSAVNRFYDLNEDPNEDQIIPMWRSSDNTGWVVNLLTGEGREIYRPTTPRPPEAGAGPWKNTGGQTQAPPKGKDAPKTSKTMTPEEKAAYERRQREAKDIEKAAKATVGFVPDAIRAMFPPGAFSENPFGEKKK
jgi:hypothetical protein